MSENSYQARKTLEAQFARALRAGIGVDVEITLRDADHWTVSGKHAAVHAATAFLTHRVGNAARLLIATIGQRPNARLTLDRIANDGHYEIGNLRWASRSQQNSNRRGPRAKVDLRMVELATID